MQNPLQKADNSSTTLSSNYTTVRRRRRKGTTTQRKTKFRTFMKMVSPDGTLSSMFPPTCSTPAKHLEIASNDWLKLWSNVKVTN
jgi:hypothetical protein